MRQRPMAESDSVGQGSSRAASQPQPRWERAARAHASQPAIRRRRRRIGSQLLLDIVGLAVVAASSSIVLARLGVVPIYITGDAGNYLADSDALIGHGVRAIGHPPLFPLVVALIRVF